MKNSKSSKRFNLSAFIWLVLALAGYFILAYLLDVRILRKSHEIVVISILINIILAASINLVLGVAGLFTLGHAGFMSIGAYSVAITLQKVSGYAGLFLGMGIGVVLTLVVALIVAIPTLRLKGDYLAIATLGAAEIIRIIIVNLDKFTGGPIGISNIEKVPNFTMIYFFAIIILYVLTALRNSRFGRAWNGVREDEIASQAMGLNLTRNKVSAFLISAMVASIAGGLYASYFALIKPEMFGFQKSIDILVIVVLGGLGSFTGTVVAAILIEMINLVFASFAQERVIIYSILLVVMMVFKPGGLLGTYEISIKKLLERREKHDTTLR
jgi:branched-chain amino acid transport system permease protein